ncbi:IS3 family transposase, partial [Mycobacterium tuberculosis]|uniref:IS3 family transposase n=1 Tax=Mycobacterium tuberculosis TaxID=1773 RepID=UPI001159A0E8
ALPAPLRRVHAAHSGVYGARPVWLPLPRAGLAVARCPVARLLPPLGLSGPPRGPARRPPLAAPAPARPAALVPRRFGPPAPPRLWVAALPSVSPWAGFASVAFVTDASAR